MGAGSEPPARCGTAATVGRTVTTPGLRGQWRAWERSCLLAGGVWCQKHGEGVRTVEADTCTSLSPSPPSPHVPPLAARPEARGQGGPLLVAGEPSLPGPRVGLGLGLALDGKLAPGFRSASEHLHFLAVRPQGEGGWHSKSPCCPLSSFVKSPFITWLENKNRF